MILSSHTIEPFWCIRKQKTKHGTHQLHIFIKKTITKQSTHKLLPTEKIVSLIKRMRRKAPPLCKEMQGFENNLKNMVKNLKFTHNLDEFRKKIINGTKQIHNSNKIYIFTDKTINIYTSLKNS